MATISLAPESNTAQRSSRLADMVQMANGLNAARVFASILVVIFHAAIPYMASPVPMWIVHDTARHVSIDLLAFWVNGFAMPLFFLLAGVSIAKSSMQKPFWEFASLRLSRLGSNFLLAAVLILPILFLSWGLGFLWTERLTIANLTRLNIPREFRSLVGPGHLWFLEYLLLLSVAWAAISRIGRRWSFTNFLIQGQWMRPIFGSTWGTMICAVPTAIILLIDIETPFRLISTFAPDGSQLLYYFVFMVAGVWLANQPEACSMLRARAPVNLLLAMVVFVGLGPVTFDLFDKTLTNNGKWAMAGLQGLFAWSMVFGFLGAMIRWCSKPNETIRYTHEASFWIYLAHLPIVCITQLAILQWQMSPWLKLMIAAAAGISISLIFYEFFIRYSVLGVVINGRRIPHATKRGWWLERGWLSFVGIVITLLSVFFWMGWNSICNNHLHYVVDAKVLRCNRPSTEALRTMLEKHKIRSVISLAVANETEDWFQSQNAVCAQAGIVLKTFAFSESRVPSAGELSQLQTAFKELPRPVLLIGGKRSPTLSSFGSAVAVLMDGGTIEQAMQQFDFRFFQLDGPERCIIAEPLREYRQWLKSTRASNTEKAFCLWAEAAQKDAEISLAHPEKQSKLLATEMRVTEMRVTELRATKLQATELRATELRATELRATELRATELQAIMGAPRYPRRFADSGDGDADSRLR